MLNFSDGLKHLYVYQLNEIGPNLSVGMNEWLSDGSDYFVSQHQLQNDFSVQTFDYYEFLKPYAFDINRLSCASIESLKDIEPKKWQPKFIGWNITKFYYSAFFSAHCILKVTGNSLSNIDANSLSTIRQRTTAYNFTYQNLNTGSYCISINPTTNTFRFFKNPQFENHEGLWRCFLQFLNSSKSSILNYLPQSDALQIIDKIEELIEALCEWNSQTGSWLSRVRNLANYSQSFGIWFPYRDYRTEYDRIYDCLNFHELNPLAIDLRTYKGKELLYFTRACQLVNAISIDLLNDLSSRHLKNKSFVTNGIQKFKNLYP